MKIQISFQSLKKKSDLYLMKVNINFVCKKKKNKFVFNENTNQFCLLKKSNLHLMKIQISFECFENQI